MEEAKEIRSRFAPLLDERPSRSTLALAEARALAASGDIAAGARALSAEIGPGNENVDLAWRLAHLEAVQGNLAEARRRAEEVIRAGASYRSEFDAPMLLMRLLVELRDRRPFGDVAAQFLEGSSITREKERFVAALHLRAHLFWDELGAEDLRTPSSTYVPEAEALSALARWRLGRTEAGDIEAAERGERENPDAMLEYRLARAAALLGLGRAREALEVVSGLVNVLGPRARVDFADRQSLDLAEAIRVKALGAAGEAARAREEALRLRARLRAGLLPRILVEEVIAGKGR